MSTKKMFWGILAGFTSGTMLGVMIASEKGVTMRKKLLGKSQQFAGNQLKKVSNLLDSIPKQYKKDTKQTKQTSKKTNVAADEKE